MKKIKATILWFGDFFSLMCQEYKDLETWQKIVVVVVLLATIIVIKFLSIGIWWKILWCWIALGCISTILIEKYLFPPDDFDQ